MRDAITRHRRRVVDGSPAVAGVGTIEIWRVARQAAEGCSGLPDRRDTTCLACAAAIATRAAIVVHVAVAAFSDRPNLVERECVLVDEGMRGKRARFFEQRVEAFELGRPAAF